MDDMDAVNVFQEKTVPELAREILLEEGESPEVSVRDGEDSEHLAIVLPECRPIQIPRFWEVEAGHPVTLKNWVAAKIQATLAAKRSSRS
ncbi:MAG: hypothetical protein AABO58_25980 [Acidobacteriota bacterium]